MDPGEYRKMAEEEDRMWWYQGLHRLLLDALERFVPRPFQHLLDAGCGTGGFLRKAEAAWPDLRIDGVDREPLAIELARSRTERSVLRLGTVHALPYTDASFDAVVLADVLYHQDVDPRLALVEARRCLRPGGVVVVNAPAYEWMRGPHDGPIHTARRFTRATLTREITAAGFEVVRATHWNTLLFPLMVVRRKVIPAQGSDVHAYPGPAQRVLGATLALERRLFRSVAAPFGGSVFVVGAR
jgi:SAM-dependent methyltransferase